METWNGNEIMNGGDPWNLTQDVRQMALKNNRVIPVYSEAERNALSDDAPSGQIPEGTVVLRIDQSASGTVLDAYIGGRWVDGDTGWEDLTSRLRNGWTASTGTVPPAVKIRNGEVQLRGQIINADAESTVDAFTLPNKYWPESAGGKLYFPLGQRSSVPMNAVVQTDGVVEIWQGSKSGAVRPLNSIRYGLT